MKITLRIIRLQVLNLRYMLCVCLAAFIMTGCASPEQKTKNFIESGMKLLSAGDLDKAKIEFKNALQIQKNNNDALYGLVLIFEKEADWQKVFNLCIQIVEQDPKYFNAHLKLGELYLASDQLDKAIDTVKKLELLKENNADVLALKASILLKLGDVNGALADAKRALQIDPKNSQATVVLASERTAAKDYEMALVHLDKGIASDPDNIALYMIKIATLESAQRIADAEGVYLSLIKRFPDQVVYRQQLAVFYVKNQQGEKGEKLLKQIVDRDPASLQAKIDLINLTRATRGDEAASKVLNDFVKVDPDNFDLRFAQVLFLQQTGKTKLAFDAAKTLSTEVSVPDQQNKAKAFLASQLIQSGKRAYALVMINEILNVDKRNEKALQLKAAIELEEKHYESAIALLRTILHDSPFSSSALLMLGQAHDLSGSRDLAEKHYLMAVESSRNNKAYVMPYAGFLSKYGEYDRAEKVLMTLVDSQSADNDVLSMLARVKIQKGDWTGAQDIAGRIKAKSGNDQLAESIIGSIYAGQKNYTESIEAFKRSYESNPENNKALVSLIRAYTQADRNKEAIQFLDNLIKTNTGDVAAQILLAKVHIKNNNKAAAIQLYKQLIVNHPSTVDAYQQLSELLRDSGRDQEAIQVAFDGLKKLPDNPNLQFVLASIYEKQKNVDAAINMYQAINAKHPNEEVIINNMVTLITDNKTDPKILKEAYDLAQAISKSDSPYIQDTVGWAAYKIGRYGEAAEMLKQAVTKMPDFALFHYHLALAHVQLKNKVEAKNAFEKTLKLKQPGDGIPENEIRKQLEQL